VVETVQTEFGVRNMVLDPKRHKLFIDAADFTPAPAPTAEQPKPQPTPVPGHSAYWFTGAESAEL
jgi:hypothetical protein